jgi:DNA-binding transcriptional LysR family regulator
MPKEPATRALRRSADSAGHLLRHATLRQLQIFEAIVRCGSFTAAAEELHLTQPTVSIQIRKLREAVGLPLFEQIGRKIFPTAVGQELYAACREMLGSLGNLEMKLAEMQGMRRGRLRIAAVTTTEYFAPSILGQFAKLYPNVDLSLEVVNLDYLYARLDKNEDDLYLVGTVNAAERLTIYPFAANPLVVIAAADHPLAQQKNIPLRALANEPFLMREPGSGSREAALRVFEEAGIRPKIRMALGSNEAIKRGVAGGLGIAVTSLYLLYAEGLAGSVVVLDVEHFPLSRQWHIVYPTSKELSIVARTFLHFVLSDASGVQERINTLLKQVQQARK